MPLPINPVVGVPLSSEIETEHVTISVGDPTFTATIYGDSTLTNLKLYVNGTGYVVGNTPTISQGDEIWVTGTSSDSYNTPTFANILLDSVAFMSVAVVTERDAALQELAPAYVDKPPVQYYGDYVPVNPDNKLVIVNTSTNAVLTKPIAPRETADPGSFSDGKPYVFAADYVGNMVHRIDDVYGVIVQTIDIPKPHGLGQTPISAINTDVIPHTLISCPGINAVYVYDGNTHTEITSVATGAGPHGICGEAQTVEQDYGFWVACFDADRVEHYYYTNGVSLERDYFFELAPGSGPYDVMVDAQGNAFVTCLISDKVAKCPAGGGTVTYVDVGADPWSLSVLGNYAYVACAGTDKVYAVETNTLVTTPISVIANVTDVVTTLTDLYVASFNIGTLHRYPFTSTTTVGNPVVYASSQRMVEGLTANSDNSKVYAVNMHNDLPERTALPDNKPDNVNLNNLSDVPINTEVDSNTIIISGVKTSTPLIVPPLSSSPITPLLFVNDAVSGVSSVPSAANDDTFHITFTTPSDATVAPVLYVPLVYDGGVRMWTVAMKDGIKKRVKGWLKGG